MCASGRMSEHEFPVVWFNLQMPAMAVLKQRTGNSAQVPRVMWGAGIFTGLKIMRPDACPSPIFF